MEKTIKIDDNLKEKFWDMFIIDALIGITCLLSVRKSFYKRIISYRYLIIKEVYDKLS